MTAQPALTFEDAEFAIDGVNAAMIEEDWDEAWPWLEKAIVRFPQVRQKYTEASIYRRLMRGEMQLWVAWAIREEKVIGAVVTEIVTEPKHPDKLFMAIPLVGGEQWHRWGDSMWNTLKAWGRAQNCTHVLAYGRKGWQRLYGFDEIGKTGDGILVMIRRLKEH